MTLSVSAAGAALAIAALALPAAADPASVTGGAQQGAHGRPSIRSVAVTPAVVPAGGGVVNVSVRVAHAATCYFPDPGFLVAGESHTVPCADGHAALDLVITLAMADTIPGYGYEVVARNRFGTTVSGLVSIGQAHPATHVTTTTTTTSISTQSSASQTPPAGATTPPVVNLDTCLPGPDCDYGPIYDTYPAYANTAPALQGDCTFAAAADYEQIYWGATADPTLIGFQFSQAGGTADGLALSALWAYWQNPGIGGYQLTGPQSLLTDQADVQNGVRDYEAMLVQLQFTDGDGFAQYTVSAGSHVAVVDGFTPEGPLVVSWGQTLQMTWQQWNAEAVGVWGIATSPST